MAVTTPSVKVSCHTGSVLVWEADGLSVYGGGTSHGATAAGIQLILDLAHNWSGWTLPAHWASSKLSPYIRVVDMYFHDGDSPAASKEFWQALWQDIVGDGVTKLLAVCQGGHGRTGTVLVCLAMAAGVVPQGSDPVAWVRHAYCDYAVETDEQIDYIEQTWGVKVKALPKATWVYGSTAGGSNSYGPAEADWARMGTHSREYTVLGSESLEARVEFEDWLGGCCLDTTHLNRFGQVCTRLSKFLCWVCSACPHTKYHKSEGEGGDTTTDSEDATDGEGWPRFVAYDAELMITAHLCRGPATCWCQRYKQLGGTDAK